jgi:hypothetical protein
MKVANNIKSTYQQNAIIKINGKIIIDDVEYSWKGEVNPIPIEKNKKEYLLDDTEEKLITEIRNLYRAITK